MDVQSIATHEAGHVVALLAHGIVPAVLTVTSNDGMVSYPAATDLEIQATVGLSGALAVLQLCGDDSYCEPSSSDMEPLVQLFAYGNRNDIREMVYRRANWLVAEHTTAIVALRERVLSAPQRERKRTEFDVSLSTGQIGSIVSEEPALQKFAPLYRKIRLEPLRRVAARKLAPSATASPAAEYLIGRLQQGKGVMPRGVSRSQMIAKLRER